MNPLTLLLVPINTPIICTRFVRLAAVPPQVDRRSRRKRSTRNTVSCWP